MNREQKTAVVEELSEQIRAAEAIFAVDYRGISVSDAADLRGRLRDAGTRFRVVKNSLTERASDQAGVEQLKPMLEGPTALAFVTGDAALAAKALNDAARAFGTLEFKGGLMNGDTLTAEQIQSIARLPSRDVLTGQLVGTIAAPLSQLVRTLNALIAGVAVQLQQMADQGLVSGEAPAAADDSAESSEPAATGEADAAEAPAETAEEPAEPATEAPAEPAPETQDGPVGAPPEEEEAAAPEPQISEETDTEAPGAKAPEE